MVTHWVVAVVVASTHQQVQDQQQQVVAQVETIQVLHNLAVMELLELAVVAAAVLTMARYLVGMVDLA